MPKYNIGDTVWQIKDNKCVSFEVSGVVIGIEDRTWEYSVEQPIILQGSGRKLTYNFQPESNFFPSKEALLHHLSEE